jgi:hypothetical protein
MDAIACEHHEKIANEPRSTSNEQTDLWVRRVSAMANATGFLVG